MREMLAQFKRETLIEYLCQRAFFRGPELESDLLFIEWDLQEQVAQKATGQAIKQLKAAKTTKQRLAAEIEWEKAQRLHKKADRIYEKMEAVRKK